MGRILDLLKRGGISVDSIALLRFLAKHPKVKAVALRGLRLRYSPAILRKIESLDLLAEERGTLFSEAVSVLFVGGTCKTTGLYRTRLVDDAILGFLVESDIERTVVEVGGSDGSASLNLIDRLPKDSSLQVTDRFPGFYIRGSAFLKRFCDNELNVVGVKALGIFVRTGGRVDSVADWEYLDTTNPLIKVRGHASVAPFDLFTGQLETPVAVIKCSNILNLCYFDADIIMRGIQNLLSNLVDGGRLYVSHNHADYHEGEAYFVVEKKAGKPCLIESRNEHSLLSVIGHHFQSGE